MSLNKDIIIRIEELLDSKTVSAVVLSENDEKKADDCKNKIDEYKNEIGSSDNINEIIDWFINHSNYYDLLPYLGIIMIKNHQLDPFEICKEISENDSWIFFNLFQFSFEYIDLVSNDRIIDLAKCLDSKKLLTLQTAAAISSYYKNKPTQLKELYDKYYVMKLPELNTIIQCSSVYFLETDYIYINEYVANLLKSKNHNHIFCGLQILLDFIKTNWSFVKDKIELIKEQVDFQKNEAEYYGIKETICRIFYRVLIFYPEFDPKKELHQIICSIIKSDPNLPIQGFLREIYSTKDSADIVLFNQEYLSLLCNTKIETFRGNLPVLDLILYSKLKNNMNEEFFHNISLFLNNNPNIRITEAFHTSSDYIIKNFNIYLPFIYKNISNSKGFNSFGRQLILSYALNNKNRIKAVDWYNGLSGNNILRIAKVVFTLCIESKFNSCWGAILIQNNIENECKGFIDLYKSLVCRNYPQTTCKIIENIDDPNKELSKLLKYCKEIISTREKICKIKDFSPSAARLQKYQIKQNQNSNKIMKESQSKSIFLSIIGRTTMKYGARPAFLQYNDSIPTLSESEYSEFGLEFEIPRIFISDPIFYQLCIDEINQEDNNK